MDSADPERYQRYLTATNELLVEFAREAKQRLVEARGAGDADFESGYVSGFQRVISLMQQQAVAYLIDPKEIGLDIDDPDLS